MNMNFHKTSWSILVKLGLPLIALVLVTVGCPSATDSNGDLKLSWHTETVDPEGNGDNSIVLDGSGHPHISYTATGGLSYARWTGSIWDGLDGTAGLDIVDTVGGYNSIALDGNGYPHISYYAVSGTGDLRYVHWTGSAWDGLDGAAGPDTADTGGFVGAHNSIALDTNGYPHISYYDNTNADLKYVHWTGSAWDGLDGAAGPDHVDTAGAVGKYTSIAIDVNDYPHISYHSAYLDSLKYARWTGSAWDGLDGTAGTDAVDTTVFGYPYTALALNGSDYPHISYYDSTNADLKYVRWTGSAWDGMDGTAGPDSVDTAGDVGQYTSIALDGNGNPHISYIDSTNADLKYVRWTGSSWDGLDNTAGPDTVDTAGALYTSIDLDGSGYPHISYYGANGLMYARYGD